MAALCRSRSVFSFSVPFSVFRTVLCALFQLILVNGTQIVSKEEMLLLNLKATTLKHRNMASWEGGADCSKWEGVICDISGHVLSIDYEILSPLEERFHELLEKLPFFGSRNPNTTVDGNPEDFRRSLSVTVGVLSNQKAGITGVKNPKLWEARAKVDTIEGVMSTPTVRHPKRVLIKKNGTSLPKISPQNLNGCNVAPRWAAVKKNAENSGVASAVVSLQLWGRTGWVSFCSGSLLSPRVVLTAAHCLYDTEGNFFYADYTYPFRVNVKRNGKSDTSYSYAYGYVSGVPRAYQMLRSWEYSLYAGSDLGVILLDRKLYSRNFRWASPYPSLTPRINYGYPGLTQDGYTLIYDVTKSRQATGCYRFSKSLLCEKLSAEPGMSGGPIVYGSKYIALGVCSGGPETGCPVYYTGLTGTYPLTDLVKSLGCKVSKQSTLSRTVYSTTC